MTLGHSEADLRNEHRIDLDRDHALDLGHPPLEEEVVARMSEGRADEYGPILDADLRAGTVEPGMSLDDLPDLPFDGLVVQGSQRDYADFGVEATQVVERFRGREVWRGTVLTFALKDHLTAKLCYAWSVDGRVTAVLHEPPVDCPLAAVRAAIASEQRT